MLASLEILAAYWLSFMVYSFVGWAFEEVMCSISEKRFLNRGFLNGPYCPIYGAGALAAYLLLGKAAALQAPIALFVLSGVVCCAIEYATSYVMEVRYHARWWDYSNRFLNLHGRICLAGGTLFGAACTLVVLFIQPALDALWALLPPWVVFSLAAATLAIFIVDNIVTAIGLSGFRKKVDEVCDQLTTRTQELYASMLDSDGPLAARVERMQNSKAADLYARLQELAPDPVAVEDLLAPYTQAFTEHLNAQERRVLDAFPSLRIANSRELAQNMRERMRQFRLK